MTPFELSIMDCICLFFISAGIISIIALFYLNNWDLEKVFFDD